MSRKLKSTLRRADRVLASAICLTLGLSAAAVAYAPYTQHNASVMQKVAAFHAPVPALPAPAPVRTVKTDTRVLQLHPTQVAYVPGSGQFNGSAISPSQAELLAQVFLQQGNCLADAMYYEARGEGRAGQMAIAEVIYNRMRAGYYPRTICSVVFEGSKLHTGCQFSFTCGGIMEQPKSSAVWRRTQRLALQIVTGIVQLGSTTGGALSFHAEDVQPGWSGTMERTTQIGHHIFYRPYRHYATRGA
ncbi:MAG TPA: cell wall hydrolase [Rhizomicrobium sp.]|jgi:spore germination cell wall hydrolase CwlJ-like protein